MSGMLTWTSKMSPGRSTSRRVIGRPPWPGGVRRAGPPQRSGEAPADRAGLAVVAVGAVGGRDAGEAVTLHDAGEALALARRGDVDELTGGEELGAELLAHGVRRGVRGADLDQVAARRDARTGEVPGGRLVHL